MRRKQADWAEGRGRELLETFILRATAATPHPPLPVYPVAGADASGARKASRGVCWSLREGFRETAVYALDRLAPGNRVEGPALVEAEDTVCPVPPGAVFTIDQYGTGVLHLDPNKQLTS